MEDTKNRDETDNATGSTRRAARAVQLLMRVRNSSLVFGSSRNTPSMVLVTVLLFIFCTPRITMHMCLQNKIAKFV